MGYFSWHAYRNSNSSDNAYHSVSFRVARDDR
jgi:hypothetical protein